MLTDQSPFEAVIALQRLDLASDTRAIVDEAASLLNDGREGEARALLEKAEALVALRDSANRTPEGEGAAVNETSRPALQGIIAPLAAKLASGFTSVLTSVLEDIHVYAGDQIQVVAKSLQDHIENMQTALRNVAGVGERLEQLANEQHDGICARLDGHTEALRALEVRQTQRVSTLNQVLETLSKLKEPESSEVALPAVA